jgi:hypothetical protein
VTRVKLDTAKHIKYEYQSVVEVFKYVVAQLLMEEGTSNLELKDVFMAIGGDHGIGPLRVTLRVIIIIQSGKIEKRDIGVATVYCKKENSTVFKNTLEPWLTADLKLIHESTPGISKDESGLLSAH